MNKDKAKNTAAIPAGAKKLPHNHLAEGEVTGHFHAANGATLYADESTDTVYADAPEGANITHQEHKEFTIPAGVYTRHIVQEFDHAKEEAVNVCD